MLPVVESIPPQALQAMLNIPLTLWIAKTGRPPSDGGGGTEWRPAVFRSALLYLRDYRLRRAIADRREQEAA